MTDEKLKLKYFHLRSDQGKGSVSIGYQVDLEKKVVSYTVAKCAPNDNFCRRIGRDICEGRFKKPKHHPPKTFEYKEYSDIKKYFVENYHPDTVQVVEEQRHPGKSAAAPAVMTYSYPGFEY